MARLHDKATKDYYAILNIEDPETVDEREIKQSYKRLSLQTHPDKNLNDPNATAQFREIKEAYETLIDPEKRRIYHIARQRGNTAGTNHANTENYDPNGWFYWFFNRNKEPRSFTDGHKPYSARHQRASDRHHASEQWYREAQQSRAEIAEAREAIRAAQKAANEHLAREKADGQRRWPTPRRRRRASCAEEHGTASPEHDGERQGQGQGNKAPEYLP
ncbi:DnaJ domain-containing protein [Xylaria acuta]|nr:DnaJ domain-containing protein [Xylaria acuta]